MAQKDLTDTLVFNLQEFIKTYNETKKLINQFNEINKHITETLRNNSHNKVA